MEGRGDGGIRDTVEPGRGPARRGLHFPPDRTDERAAGGLAGISLALTRRPDPSSELRLKQPTTTPRLSPLISSDATAAHALPL